MAATEYLNIIGAPGGVVDIIPRLLSLNFAPIGLESVSYTHLHKACAADEQHRAAGRPKQCAERAVAGGTADQGHHRHTRNEEPEEQQHHRRPCRLTACLRCAPVFIGVVLSLIHI